MVSLQLPEAEHALLLAHLLPADSSLEEDEQAAFVIASPEERGQENVLRHVETILIGRTGFTAQSRYYLELCDEERARVIKRAHDLEGCLVEFHSHPSHWPAAFSPSDLAGLAEFVPHVRWRLRQRPYAAVVVALTGFDGLAWHGESLEARLLDRIVVGDRVLEPTGLSFKRMGGSR